MNLTDVLQWLTGADGGAFLVVTWFASWGLEKASWFQNLTSTVRSLLIVVISGLLGAGAVYLQANPAIVEGIEPYLQPVIYAVLVWLGTQTAHKFNHRSNG